MCEYLRNGKNKIRNKWSVYNQVGFTVLTSTSLDNLF